MSDPKIPDIPAIGSLPDQLRNLEVFLRKTRELIQTREPVADSVGDPLDKFVSRRELVKSGLTYRSGGFAGIGTGSAGPAGPPGPPGGGYVPDLTPPPTPTGLTVVAGFTQLIIQCDAALYTQGHGHDRTLVYGAKWPSGAPPTFSNAVPLMDFQGTIANYATDMATRWCIWIKWQSVDGVLSTSPAGGVNGVQATTGQDIATLLTLLTGQITESQLYAALGARINLIDGVGAGSVNARILTESAARITGDSASADLVTTLQASINAAGANRLRNSGFEVISPSPSRASGWFAYNNSPGEISTLSLVAGRLGGAAQRHAWTGSNTSQKGMVSSDTNDGTNLGGVTGRWAPNTTYVVSWYARSGATIAGGMQMGWNVSPATQTVLLNPSVTTAWSRWATRITMGASVEQNGRLYISIIGAGTGYIELDDVQVQEGSLLTGYAPGDQAELVASVQTEATARANADGTLFAQYTVKLDVNGYVSGYGLASTSTGAVPTSSFIIRADSFAIASPSGPGITPAVPFIVRTVPTTENGVSIPVGVYMDAAYIVNVSAMYARFGTLVADSIAAGQINAANLTLGTGTVGGNLKSSGFVAGSQGWIVRPNGTAEFEFAHIRGTLQVGQIAANFVTATMIDSRGLSIKDAAGNVILAAGTGLDFNARFPAGTTGMPANFANRGAVGGYVNSDPLLQAPLEWTFQSVIGANPNYYGSFGVGNGLQIAWDKVAGGTAFIFSSAFPVSPFKTYLVESSLYLWAANTATHYLACVFYDSLGNVLSGSSFPTGWPGAGSFHYYGILGTVQAPGAVRYAIKFGAMETAKIPVGAVSMKVAILGGYNNTADRWSWGGAQVREVVDGATLAITSTNASTYIANAAIGTAQVGTLNASVIAAGTITTDRLVANAATVASAGSFASTTTNGASVASINPAAVAVFSLTTTGAPVTIGGNIFCQGQSSVLTGYMKLEVAVFVDGVQVQTVFSIGVQAYNDFATTYTAHMQGSIAIRVIGLAAGSHSYGYRASVYFYDTSGVSLSPATSSLVAFGSMFAQENKV